jgi:hypothetical protein
VEVVEVLVTIIALLNHLMHQFKRRVVLEVAVLAVMEYNKDLPYLNHHKTAVTEQTTQVAVLAVHPWEIVLRVVQVALA